ncbi:type 1 glutamine amidotransferase [Curvibacter sp. APW13]|uniref:type 1 glutamine amidotransferase n=1 Tax=Curvibacter sp. APW13 TaxID=3077236 RepID=UPI0028DE6DD9|nr:type 1 glutamine amidotransferase [Curvibacter sp. APW13]MDT8992431.1 type 1 glutamine amidotransferase [Curvibacter sp. APW13]
MLPIAIVQHVANDGPSFFATWCAQQQLPVQVYAMHDGATLPPSMAGHSGLCILGGPMSANDPLPYFPQLFALIREAIALDRPVIGHCLGGQLISRALGGTVQASEHAEIGWSSLRSTDAALANEWFGPDTEPVFFQWHGESFSIPAGAQQVLTGAHCRNQAYVLNNRHIGMQFHCEVDEAKVREWIIDGHQEMQERNSPGVQRAEAILPTLSADIAASQVLASRIYTRWARGLQR